MATIVLGLKIIHLLVFHLVNKLNYRWTYCSLFMVLLFDLVFKHTFNNVFTPIVSCVTGVTQQTKAANLVSLNMHI